jgi:asparagine synthase (glutamine-hydrolysing)
VWHVSFVSSFRDYLQELVELGPRGLAFRLRWELGLRSGIVEALERTPARLSPESIPTHAALEERLPFCPRFVAEAMRDRLSSSERSRLRELARNAASGRILAFGRWTADYGLPLDWQLNPTTGTRWNPAVHWSKALRDEPRAGDVKLAWEIARFPHAYHLARAAALEPALSDELAQVLADQISAFVVENPYGRGIHWNSSQEVVFRLMAWSFAIAVFGTHRGMSGMLGIFAEALNQGAVHVERNLEYARKAVYNNHLLSEAFGLLLAAELLPQAPRAQRWMRIAVDVLTRQADRQFYEDGGYIQQSHNYERVALQIYLWAAALLRRGGVQAPGPWLSAVGRAVDFMYSQQNPADGRLPNYGANDGALPSPLTSCDYSDFRPTLQAASLVARGERLYPPGPWDEEALWLLGSATLDAPLRKGARKTVSFRPTGFHVLRGRDESTFAVFRCGTVRDRFSQIDMLHLDVWWRGVNVLVDPGSYLYNGPAVWHRHFATTAAHNTVVVDGRDQMLHYRRFKNLYWTRAKLLRFEDATHYAVVEGEHGGYRRQPGRCIHRRAVLFARDDLWIVVDHVQGELAHTARVQWLGGPYPHAYEPQAGRLTLATSAGEFCIAVVDEQGAPLNGDVVAGGDSPQRGWLSRYYGEKTPAPSLAVELRGAASLTAVSLLSRGPAAVNVSGGEWSVAATGVRARFRMASGRFADIRVEPA